MPTYQYKCPSCEEIKSVIYGITEEAPSVSCACGAEMKKIFSSPQVAFKGIGWGKDAR
jgi:putative FmdB family regulatory protein